MRSGVAAGRALLTREAYPALRFDFSCGAKSFLIRDLWL